MYKVKNKVYSEAGSIIKKKGFTGYACNGELSDFTEEKLNIKKFKIEHNNICIGDIVLGSYNPNKTYADYKTNIIKGRYSNDDQIAIILNKDNSEEDLKRFNKMQEWREWASTLANLIIEYKKESK